MKKTIFALMAIMLFGLSLSACLPKKDSAEVKADQAVKFESLQALIDSDLALRCTWSYVEDETNASGELYGQGKRFYQTATYEDAYQNVEITSVSDGEWMYMWSPDQPQAASKIRLDKLNDLNETAAAQDAGDKVVNLEKDINLLCYPWLVDEAKFLPPEGVEFLDLTSMLSQAKEMVESGSMCANCNYIQAGPERDDCLAALNCL